MGFPRPRPSSPPFGLPHLVGVLVGELTRLAVLERKFTRHLGTFAFTRTAAGEFSVRLVAGCDRTPERPLDCPSTDRSLRLATDATIYRSRSGLRVWRCRHRAAPPAGRKENPTNSPGRSIPISGWYSRGRAYQTSVPGRQILWPRYQRRRRSLVLG